MLAFWRYLLNCRNSLWWRDVNFFDFWNQNSCMPLWPGVLRFGIFLGVSLSEFWCMFEAFFEFFQFFFDVIYSYSIYVMFFHSPHFLQHCSVSFASGCWFVFVYSPVCRLNFLWLFWNVLFYLYCLTLSRYLLRFPSFANIFWSISSGSVVRLVCGCLFGHFFFSLGSYVFFLPEQFRLFVFLFLFSIQVLYFFSDFFGGYLFYHSLLFCFCID